MYSFVLPKGLDGLVKTVCGFASMVQIHPTV
jgi:hypothetical protein